MSSGQPDQLEAGAYRRQRIAQLMGEHREELVLVVIGRAQRCLGASSLDSLPRALARVLDHRMSSGVHRRGAALCTARLATQMPSFTSGTTTNALVELDA